MLPEEHLFFLQNFIPLTSVFIDKTWTAVLQKHQPGAAAQKWHQHLGINMMDSYLILSTLILSAAGLLKVFECCLSSAFSKNAWSRLCPNTRLFTLKSYIFTKNRNLCKLLACLQVSAGQVQVKSASSFWSSEETNVMRPNLNRKPGESDFLSLPVSKLERSSSVVILRWLKWR